MTPYYNNTYQQEIIQGDFQSQSSYTGYVISIKNTVRAICINFKFCYMHYILVLPVVYVLCSVVNAIILVWATTTTIFSYKNFKVWIYCSYTLQHGLSVYILFLLILITVNCFSFLNINSHTHFSFSPPLTPKPPPFSSNPCLYWI